VHFLRPVILAIMFMRSSHQNTAKDMIHEFHELNELKREQTRKEFSGTRMAEKRRKKRKRFRKTEKRNSRKKTPQ